MASDAATLRVRVPFWISLWPTSVLTADFLILPWVLSEPLCLPTRGMKVPTDQVSDQLRLTCVSGDGPGRGCQSLHPPLAPALLPECAWTSECCLRGLRRAMRRSKPLRFMKQERTEPRFLMLGAFPGEGRRNSFCLLSSPWVALSGATGPGLLVRRAPRNAPI